jgi:hypothetical protein
MGLIDKMREGAEQATSRARESVQEVQLKHDLAQAYSDLGRATYKLVEQGEISAGALESPAAHVRELESQLAALGAGSE